MALLLPPALAALARQQFGLVTAVQGRQWLTRSQFYRLVASGVLVPVAPGVYCVAGTPPSWRQRAMAGCLDVGGTVAVSHLAAAYLWQAEGLAAPEVELTVAPNRHPRARATGPNTTRRAAPHRLPLAPLDVTRRWGIPVTTPARTLIDLSGRAGPLLFQRIADSLLRRRVLTVGEVDRRLGSSDPLPRCDRGALDALLRHREQGVGASPPEDWVYDTLVGAGLPPPLRHYVVVVGDEVRELDCAYPDWKIGIDYDGWSAHHDVAHFHGDRGRLAAFQLEGWILFQVTARWSAALLVSRVWDAVVLRGRAPAAVP